MPSSPEHRWILLDHPRAWGWTRSPRPAPRLHLRPLDGPGPRVWLEADVPGRRAVLGSPPLTDLGLAVARDRTFVEAQWLDDCLVRWDWLTARVVDGAVVVSVYGGTPRAFTRRVPAARLPVQVLHGPALLRSATLQPTPPRLRVESTVGGMELPLTEVVFGEGYSVSSGIERWSTTPGPTA